MVKFRDTKLLSINAIQLAMLHGKQKAINHLLQNAVVDKMQVKHLDIVSSNTLTTPKIVLSEAGADPASNGEMTMNGGVIKGKSGGTVKNIGGTLALDEKAAAAGSVGSVYYGSGIAVTGKQNGAYASVATKAIVIDVANEEVFVCGFYAAFAQSAHTVYARIKNNASTVLATNSAAFGSTVVGGVGVEAQESAPSVATHTYTLEAYSSGTTPLQSNGVLYGVAVKLT